MIYRIIGLMSGSSLDGLDIAYVVLEEVGGKWTFDISLADCIPYNEEWASQLSGAKHLNAGKLASLDMQFGKFLGEKVNQFIEKNQLEYKVALISSHGHTVFHEPGISSLQIGHGAGISALTRLPVVSDLRSMDIALGGQGAPIVPMGEKLLFPSHKIFLNIGGIANISFHDGELHDAFDVCPANRVLNLLCNKIGKDYDDRGALAKEGKVNSDLLQQLNALPYYREAFPKSLANEFGTEVIFPMIESFEISVADALSTFVEHISFQVADALRMIMFERKKSIDHENMLITGGGALNDFLVERLSDYLSPLSVQVDVPDTQVIQYKEALIMAMLGVLRWREEDTVISTVTGSSRNSIGGALWMGS